MPKETSIIPSTQDRDQKTFISNAPRLAQSRKSPRLGIWIACLLALGLVIVGSVSYIAWNWLRNLQIPLGVASTQAPPTTTFNVQRTATYANLNFTVLNTQYAAAFPDDLIQSGPAVVRVNMRVTNKTTSQISIIYYDVARLLAPKTNPIAPTNVNLSTGPRPGASETGWIDFPVAKGTQLAALKLQLGSITLGETLVIIPFSGSYNPDIYADKLSPQSLTFSYAFQGNILDYHLTSVGIRYSYQGTPCRAGDQYYVLNFTVDNNNSVDVSPGYGYDYIRLVVNGYNRPPIDNTLNNTFKAGSHAGGRVVFLAPKGFTTLNIVFLLQYVVGQDNFSVNL